MFKTQVRAIVFLCVLFWGAGGYFFLIGWGVFFIFWGWVWGIQFSVLIGDGGVFPFFKLKGSGGHHSCFLRGWGL